jgi:hypothetical protein
MKSIYLLPTYLLLSFLANFSFAAPAEIKISELVMSDAEIATRKNISGTARTLTYYINTKTTSEFRTPEE